jgi:hypothetical protein
MVLFLCRETAACSLSPWGEGWGEGVFQFHPEGPAASAGVSYLERSRLEPFQKLAPGAIFIDLRFLERRATILAAERRAQKRSRFSGTLAFQALRCRGDYEPI